MKILVEMQILHNHYHDHVPHFYIRYCLLLVGSHILDLSCSLVYYSWLVNSNYGRLNLQVM